MSDSQDPFDKDPAGWTQVGLAIGAFDIAIIAFADIPPGVAIGLRLSVFASAVFVLGMLSRSVFHEVRIRAQQEMPSLNSLWKRSDFTVLISLFVAGFLFYVTIAAWIILSF